MPHYNAEFSVLGSTTGGCQFYARNHNGGYLRLTVSNANHTKCDYSGTYQQLTTLSHFGYLRHKYLKARK